MARAPNALGLLLPALILFAVIKNTSRNKTRNSRREKQQQTRNADDCAAAAAAAAAAAVDFVCLEPAAAQEKPMKGLSGLATVIVDAEIEDDTPDNTPKTWDTFPEMTFYMPALYMPPLLSKALVALLHLVTFFVTCVIATAVGPFGSVALLLVALSSPFVISIHRWWNKALDEAIGIMPTDGTASS
jgi:hypothetical protein